MNTLNRTLAVLLLSGLGTGAALAQSQPMAPTGAMSGGAMNASSGAMAGDKMATDTMPMKSTGKKMKTHKKSAKATTAKAGDAMAPMAGDSMAPMGH